MRGVLEVPTKALLRKGLIRPGVTNVSMPTCLEVMLMLFVFVLFRKGGMRLIPRPLVNQSNLKELQRKARTSRTVQKGRLLW